MYLIDKHNVQKILTATFIISCALLSLSLSKQLFVLLDTASAGLLQFNSLLLMLLFTSVPNLGTVFPTALFLAIFLHISKQHANQEACVLAASGVSLFDVLRRSVGISALVIASWMAVFSLWLTPHFLAQANAILNTHKNAFSFAHFKAGRFQSLEKNWILYPKHIDKNGVATGVMLIKIQDTMRHYISAQSARILIDKKTKQPYIYLKSGEAHTLDTSSHKIKQSSQFDDLFLGYSKLLQDTEVNTSSMPLSQLDDNNLAQKAEKHWRFNQIIIVFVVASLALSLSYVAPRKKQMGKLIPAIALLSLYLGLCFALRNTIEKGNSALWLYVHHAAFFAIALYLTHRATHNQDMVATLSSFLAKLIKRNSGRS